MQVQGRAGTPAHARWRWVPWANVFSVGDVLIAAGGLVFALVATESFRRRPGLRSAPTSGETGGA